MYKITIEDINMALESIASVNKVRSHQIKVAFEALGGFDLCRAQFCATLNELTRADSVSSVICKDDDGVIHLHSHYKVRVGSKIAEMTNAGPIILGNDCSTSNYGKDAARIGECQINFSDECVSYKVTTKDAEGKAVEGIREAKAVSPMRWFDILDLFYKQLGIDATFDNCKINPILMSSINGTWDENGSHFYHWNSNGSESKYKMYFLGYVSVLGNVKFGAIPEVFDIKFYKYLLGEV